MKPPREDQCVFMIAPEGTGDGVPLVVIGIPAGAWEYAKDGKTHTFDLTKGPSPVPVKIVLFGAPDAYELKRMVDQLLATFGSTIDQNDDADYSIKPPRFDA